MRPILVVFYLLVSFAELAAQSPSSLVRTDTRLGLAAAGTVSFPFDFVVDTSTGGGDVLDIVLGDPNVLISLVRPDGAEVTVSSAPTLEY